MITRAAIVSEAREWIDTPFHLQQSVKGVGADCIGLIKGIARNVGVAEAAAIDADFSFAGYGPTPYRQMLVLACDKYLVRLPRHMVGLGDIVLMRMETEPQHVALISRINPFYVIHAHVTHKRVLENGLDVLRDPRITHAYRFRGVCN